MTLKFCRVLAVVELPVRTKLQQAKCQVSYRANREKTQMQTIGSFATARTVESKVRLYHRCNKRLLRFLFRSRFLRFLTFFKFVARFFIFKERCQTQGINM